MGKLITAKIEVPAGFKVFFAKPRGHAREAGQYLGKQGAL